MRAIILTVKNACFLARIIYNRRQDPNRLISQNKEGVTLTPSLFKQIQIYIDLLRRIGGISNISSSDPLTLAPGTATSVGS